MKSIVFESLLRLVDFLLNESFSSRSFKNTEGSFKLFHVKGDKLRFYDEVVGFLI